MTDDLLATMSVPVSGQYAQVLLDIPIAAAFDYLVTEPFANVVSVGAWVVVPWGRTRRVGIVRGFASSPGVAAERVRAIESVLTDAPVLPDSWFALGRFATGYYHRHPGEILMPAIPKLLRVPPSAKLVKPVKATSKATAESNDAGEPTVSLKPAKPAKQGKRSLSTAFTRARKKFDATELAAADSDLTPPPDLTDGQRAALSSLNDDTGFQVSLLHGITGSGKTEVYLQWLAGRLALSPENQVLLLVPEIALTPQLAERVSARLGGPVAILHSGMAEGERAGHWLAAVEGRARIVVGTRLSVLVPLRRLAGIVVDEEHDPSFKQQEAPHYSARDLAVLRAREDDVPIVLGSATPSLETWHAAHSGRYRYLGMPSRAGGAPLPAVEIESLRGVGREQQSEPADDGLPEGLTQAAVDAISECLGRGDQVLIFLNRRGYAPVLNCANCDWLSECENCSAYRVLHRLGQGGQGSGGQAYQLVCHHCGTETRVPRHCPGCGDLNLRPLGRGTQRIEEVLVAAFPKARVARIDRDVARRRGAADAVIDSIHRGEVDIVIGTQMLAKGHDFRRLNLVVVLDADGGLFASDFRAPERLFATLTQVAGRAGRDMAGAGARVIVQTRFDDHPIFKSLESHDYAGFADQQLQERRDAVLPPFSFQALLRVEARDLDQAIQFGREARLVGLALIATRGDELAAVSVFDPVPMPLARLAGKARAQLLVESASRPQLHRFIGQWQDDLSAQSSRVRWQIEIDPAQI